MVVYADWNIDAQGFFGCVSIVGSTGGAIFLLRCIVLLKDIPPVLSINAYLVPERWEMASCA